MVKIIREEKSEHSTLSMYYIALNLIGYISFYNALVELNKRSTENDNRKNRNLQNFLVFANTAVIKDFSIVLNELYTYLEALKPNGLDSHKEVEPRFNEFLRFIKKTKNNMKFHPIEKKINKILEREKDKYPNVWGKNNKDMQYYCGYFMGNNVVFGSNWYREYMFYEPKKICKNEGDLFLFTNSIIPHLQSFFNTFEEVLFNDKISIPKIKLKQSKRFFQLYPKNTNSQKVFKKSKYDKITTFMLLLVLEEIASIQIYYDYYLDIEESIKDNLLLYFFTYILAIKYDEIRDCLETLRDNQSKFGINPNFKQDFNNLGVLKTEITDFAFKLRNSYHYTEIEKYKIYANSNEKVINIKDLYLAITQTEKWPDDYLYMFNAMKEELNIILEFCRKSIGINYG